MKEGIFIGPQITQPFDDQDFSTKLTSTERRAWKSFENVCRNFLVNEKASNYSESVQETISSHRVVECSMSLKLHFLHSHLDFCTESKAAISDEHDEMSHQYISQIEKMYGGK